MVEQAAAGERTERTRNGRAPILPPTDSHKDTPRSLVQYTWYTLSLSEVHRLKKKIQHSPVQRSSKRCGCFCQGNTRSLRKAFQPIQGFTKVFHSWYCLDLKLETSPNFSSLLFQATVTSRAQSWTPSSRSLSARSQRRRAGQRLVTKYFVLQFGIIISVMLFDKGCFWRDAGRAEGVLPRGLRRQPGRQDRHQRGETDLHKIWFESSFPLKMAFFKVHHKTRLQSSTCLFLDLLIWWICFQSDHECPLFSYFQLAQLLPMEETFLLLFRFDNPLDSSVEFMKVGQWEVMRTCQFGRFHKSCKNFQKRGLYVCRCYDFLLSFA